MNELSRHLPFNPSVNPAVLDTCTWDPEGAKNICREETAALGRIGCAARTSRQAVEGMAGESSPFILYASSLVSTVSSSHLLAGLPDGQKLFLVFSERANLRDDWGFDALDCLPVNSSNWRGYAFLLPADRLNTKAFLRNIAPFLGLKALGSVSRLGIGMRMSALVWPGVIDALLKTGVSANIIQNSVGRELAPMEKLLDRGDIGSITLPGLGAVQIGHTGSSIEGLWLHGVLSAIARGLDCPPYGADADHIPVKRSADSSGLAHAKRLVDCARDYTFFTADTSDLFDYHAYTPGDLDSCRKKYHDSIHAAAELYAHISGLKNGEDFDFEFSMDEVPPEIATKDAVTTPEEVVFVLTELQRLGLKITHVAPNFGVEKGVDYRLEDGLPGLKKRVLEIAGIADGFGVVLDFHSGDDLSAETRHAIAEATGGKLHFKVSPQLQLLYAETLHDCAFDLFNDWWNWTLEHTKAEADAGNHVAEKYLSQLDERRVGDSGDFRPLPTDDFFRNFAFAAVGKRESDGSFAYRDRFYSAGSAVEAEYRSRVKEYIVELAASLGL